MSPGDIVIAEVEPLARGEFARLVLLGDPLLAAARLGCPVQRLQPRVRVRLLRRMASQPYTYFLQRNSGDLLKKVLGDVLNYTTGVLLPILDMVARTVTTVLLLATLFLVQPVIALSAAIGLGGFYVTTFRLLARKRREVDENLRISVGGLFREAQQMLGGIKPIKVHRAEEHFLARFGADAAERSGVA